MNSASFTSPMKCESARKRAATTPGIFAKSLIQRLVSRDLRVRSQCSIFLGDRRPRVFNSPPRSVANGTSRDGWEGDHCLISTWCLFVIWRPLSQPANPLVPADGYSTVRVLLGHQAK